MKKRLFSLLLAALMLVGTLAVSLPVSASLNFNDTDGHWGEAAIEYVVENGLMNGIGDGTSFAPNMSLTRGMVVTVLYRDNGSPKQNFKGTFLDVKEGMYYTAAAEWAYANGIVNGTGNDEWGEPYFSPDRDITRQELATMFVRYAYFKHVDTTKKNADIASFPDAASVADWASDAVKWAVGVGLITGKGNGGAATLSPTDKAVRAEFATIIKRFKEAEFEYHLVYNTPVVQSTYTEKPYAKVENADVYVAVDGNDSNAGTKDKPLATFEAAKAKVRELKKTAKDEIIVAFKAGNYGVLDNVTFTEEDSGSENVPITYCKYGDGDVIFSNGKTLYAEDFVSIDENENEYFPDEAVSKIKKLSIEGLLTSEIQISNYIFSETDGILWIARDLNKIADQNNYYSNKVTESSDRTKSIKLLPPLTEKIQSFSTLDGLMINGMLRSGFHYDRFDVLYYDPETQELYVDIENYINLMPDMPEGQFTYHGGFAVEGRMETKIFFYNLPEFLDDQGEYWVDTKKEILYVYNPRDSYTFCTDGTMMTLDEGADHISFVGLEFNGCADTVIYSNADYTTFDRCKFKSIGGHYAVKATDVNHFSFINSDVQNFVDGGVYLISDADFTTLTSAGNVIKNNSFRDFGLPEYWSNAIRIMNDVGCIIEHNEFRNGSHGAIRYDGCIDTLIQYNVFDSMMQTTQDYGAVYCINNIVHRDNVIRYNLFMNITGEAKQVFNGCYGIYVDNDTCGQHIYGNIFYNGGYRAIVLHDGRDNIVEDNIAITIHNKLNQNTGDFLMYTAGLSAFVGEDGNLIDDTHKVRTIYKRFGEPEVYDEYFYTFNGYYQKGFPQEGEEGYELWYERWPLIYNYHLDTSRINEVECLFNTINYIKNNAVLGNRLYDEVDQTTPKMLEEYSVNENNVVYPLDENPFFVNPSVGDYTLREDADFHKIPYEQIGRY